MTTHEQLSEKSCAAACLMVAAHELDVGSWEGTSIVPENFRDLEESIHEHTSDGTMDYSMPAHIGDAARKMGMKATVHMVGLVLPWVMHCVYPKAEKGCDDLNVPVKKMSLMPLLPGQRQLCAVEFGNLNLHWVLMRPNWTYMDPADGQNHWFWLSQGQGFWKLEKYIYTGISVVVEPGEQMALLSI